MEGNVAMNAHLPNLHLLPGGHAQNLGIVNWNYPAFTLVERRWLPKIMVDWEVFLPSVVDFCLGMLQVCTHPCRVSFFPSCCLGLFSFNPSFRDWSVCFFMFSLPMWFLFLFCSVCPLFVLFTLLSFVFLSLCSLVDSLVFVFYVFFSFVLCFFFWFVVCSLACFSLFIVLLFWFVNFFCMFYIFSLAFKLPFLFSCLLFFLFCSRVFTFFFSLVFVCSLACCSLFVVLFLLLLFMFFLFFNCHFCFFPMVFHFLFSCLLSCPLPVLNLVWHCLSFFLSSVVFLFSLRIIYVFCCFPALFLCFPVLLLDFYAPLFSLVFHAVSFLFSSMAQLWQAIQKGHVQSKTSGHPPWRLRAYSFQPATRVWNGAGPKPRNIASLGPDAYQAQQRSTGSTGFGPSGTQFPDSFNCGNPSPPSMTSRHRGCYSWFVLATAACGGPALQPVPKKPINTLWWWPPNLVSNVRQTSLRIWATSLTTKPEC